jgi:hypothetical protein
MTELMKALTIVFQHSLQFNKSLPTNAGYGTRNISEEWIRSWDFFTLEEKFHIL